MKKPKKLRIIALLCLVFAILLVAACSKGETGGITSATTAETKEGEVPTEPKDPNAPDLPDVDMGGKVFTLLTYTGWGGDSSKSDIAGEEQTGDPIRDAAFNRRIKIEQQFNCQIKVVNPNDHTETLQKYQTAILAGDASYDYAITPSATFASLLTGNYLIDFKELVYIDIDKPYWNKNLYDSMAIMGKNYAADGDISKRRLECVWIMCFNKDILRDNNLESPYDLVKSGQWTFDKMMEMGRVVARDLDGDGKMKENDLYGLNYTGDTIMGLINGCGVKIAEIDEKGIPQLTIGTEANLEKMMKIYTETRDDSWSIDTLFRFWLGDIDIFSDSRALFLACAGHNVVADTTSENATNTQGLRTIDVDFGIIPYPKWDAAQSDYMPHTAGSYHPIMSIPNTNEDLDNLGIFLEAMSWEGSKELVPAFYESLLKTKTARDDESAEMIDYIFGNLSYDVGNMYNFGEIVGTFGYGMS
ncbi:MAG: extracellular solute-binding protein, partial [Oscillospiraceae bacterium]|nr:extracellular solute-binding protein [Oscillospiraceae bacterium]